MLRIGDNVILNLLYLESINFAALRYGETGEENDYVSYIYNNVNKAYIIANILEDDKNIKYDAPYILNDEFLATTSFCEDELIII